MVDLPPDAVEAAAQAMDPIVPNSNGVLWEFDEVMDDATGQTMKRPVTLTDAARAALSAALPALREALAQEVEAERYKRPATWCEDFEHGLDRAARIVRGEA